MFHIWPHLAYSCSLQILSPGTGDQNGCQTYLTLAKLWATDKRGRLFALPLASFLLWRCSRPAWQCPAWHTQHAAGWKFTVPCHSSYANFAPNKLWLGSVSKHVHRQLSDYYVQQYIHCERNLFCDSSCTYGLIQWKCSEEWERPTH